MNVGGIGIGVGVVPCSRKCSALRCQ